MPVSNKKRHFLASLEEVCEEAMRREVEDIVGRWVSELLRKTRNVKARRGCLYIKADVRRRTRV